MRKLEEIKKAIEAENPRSAWDKGVKLYALELLEQIAERAEWEEHEPESLEELKDYALNGAKDWKQYSYGGSSLIYDFDIAERLCTPSELKKCKGGEKNPNTEETWLDCQARALNQAFNLINANKN